jgi:hypothetical protein
VLSILCTTPPAPCFCGKGEATPMMIEAAIVISTRTDRFEKVETKSFYVPNGFDKLFSFEFGGRSRRNSGRPSPHQRNAEESTEISGPVTY